MLPAKTCNNLAMAVPLSSPIISPKPSINISINTSVSRRYCALTPRSFIPLNRTATKSFQSKLVSCILSKLEPPTVMWINGL
ncbi:hypothetical protein HanOQP8_Chr03g0109791 [Helianthus annuus]|nr:hypothetical protein HanOQP8_Chr03g0109791 [Helianthus annuus]